MTAAAPATPEYAVSVYAFGIPSRGPDGTTQVPPLVVDQLRMANRLRNHLVELQLAHEDRVKAIWSAHPRIGQVEARIADLEERVGELAVACAAERSRQQKKGPTPSSPALADARRELREARAHRRELIGAARVECRPRLAESTAILDAAIKDAYRVYCQDGILIDVGQPSQRRDWLHHATYTAVVDRHKVAARRVAAARAQGRAATLRFRRFDGTGALTVGLLRQAGMPVRTPAVVADPAGKYRNVFVLPIAPAGKVTKHDPRKRGDLRFYVGHSRWVGLPVVVHREIPPDADITSAQLVVREVAGQYTMRACVTARVTPAVPVTDGPTVAVHLGWRRDEDGIRVATWRADTPVEVPASLAPWLVADTDRAGRVCIPSRWRDRIDSHDHMRSQRDTARDKVKAELCGWLAEHGPVPHPTRPDVELTAAVVERWRSPARFAALARAWRHQPPESGVDIAEALEAWRAADACMWRPEAHGRDAAIGQRDDAYRRVGAWIGEVAGRVVVDDTVVSELARKPDPGAEPDQPTEVVERASSQRMQAAPGRLRELVVAGCRSRGVEVVTVPHTGTTRTHHSCGYVNPADGRYARSRIVPCDGCGGSYDQDASATMIMLDAAGGGSSPETSGTAR